MFKRLTYHVKDGRYSLQKKRTSENIQEAINRLGEYENIWLTPEEIIKLLNTHDKLNTALDKAIDIIGDSRCPPEAINRLAECEDSELSPEEVQELAKAKADGRLKILPAKPGDIIYRPEALQFCWVITKVEIYEDEIVFIDDSDNIFRPDDIGKTVFLTREEAEAALQKGKI